MKHLYLLIGSSCETGKGLFIFFVREHSALERQLLLISKQNSNSSVFENTISSMGCWIRTEKFGAASKETLSSIKQASTNTEISLEATDQNSNNGTVSSSQQLDFTSPVLEENKDVAINETPSRSSIDGPTTTLPDGNSMLNNNGTLSQEIQPIYANTFSVGRPNSLGRCGIALRDKPGSKVAEQAGSMDPDSPTDLPAPPIIKRPWRMNCQFEPIEESEERISSTDSSVTLQPLTDVFPIVTSSTMEDEDLVFGSMNSSGECTENEFECDEKPKFDLMSKPSNAIARSATWNGIPHGKEWHLSNKRKEASAQTVEEEDSAEFRVLTSTKL